MEKISIKEILDATGGKLVCGNKNDFILGVKHDSRECGKNDMFVAVKGENQDGHIYIPQVIGKGCRTLLVSKELNNSEYIIDEKYNEDVNVIRVEDTIRAMGDLAKYYLSTLDVKKIAVTGSVGKTSVRDMIYYVLSEKYRCGRNMKNFNNLIGLPLSIFQFDKNTQVVVLEMGMSEFGEIDRLSEIVAPNIGIITNIGVAHMQTLGSREGIFKAKMEMTKHICADKDGEGILIFVNDDDFLSRERTKGSYKQISIGENGKSDYIISDIDDFGLDGIKFTLEHSEKCRRIRVPVPGRHNAINASIAVAIGDIMHIGTHDIEEGLGKVNLTGSRLKQIDNGRIRVIDDTYNASPDSMKSALKVLEKSICSAEKIAILGDMYELGKESEKQHLGVGMFARGLDIDKVIAIGKDAEKIYEGASGGKAEVLYYREKNDFYCDMDQFTGKGNIILVKGSRGMHMEQIVENILKH